ncbi:PUA-like domain-containing protein [Crepidotus variabilis]|uniref:PUA-like domain-containing protein n=1 Tax=Crepidotus variabilis TaxID=179855 RepID=A0A9P6EEU0_9AGAR|nr:PUA-like domain-containing protein [Crepidotus variabilis]
MAAERLRQQFMQDVNLYKPDMMGKSKYGPLPNVDMFATYANRDCSDAGVHPTRNAGIAGSIKEGGAYSVCLSGGYEDDKDDGDFFVYTGTGGQEDSWSGHGKQTCDQDFDHPHNAALKISAETRRPIRVVRGSNRDSEWAPVEGFRYDGLYIVERAYYDKGKSGFRVCKYDIRRVPNQAPIPKNPDYMGARRYH